MKQHVLVATLFVLCATGLAQNGAARRNGAPICGSLPCIVASVSLTDQTAPIPPTTLVTPAANGLFRVTYYLESSRVQGSVWGVSFNWRDEMKTRTTGTLQAQAGTITAGTIAVRSITGHAITYTASAGGTPPPDASYNLFITVEQVQ